MIELAAVVILGIFAQWLAWRIKMPAILPLIIIGLLVGPVSSLFTADGTKLLEPMYIAGEDRGLFAGNTLYYFVSLAIGLILFEGGLTLNVKELRGAGPAIIRLITIGSVVTFFGAAVACHFIVGLSWTISALFAGLIIVTGPTVIAPILRNLPLNRNVSTVLKWEGILIDPIGALVAVLVFEFIASGASEGFTMHGLAIFGKVVLVGTLEGVIGAYVLAFFLKRKWIPHYLINVFVLALVLFLFVNSDFLAHESGLLTVVVMGMMLANMKVPHLDEILEFKESITVLLISVLFILLSANINASDFYLLGWPCLVLFAVVLLVIRPIGVFLSTLGSDITKAESAFISWVGPRGIVAAGIASLFGNQLYTTYGVEEAQIITPLVFMIVLGTVIVTSFTAGPMAKLLGVTKDVSNGILIVGASEGARLIATYLRDNGRLVAMVDSSASNIQAAKDQDLFALRANVFEDDLSGNLDLLDMGFLIAMTGSDAVNKHAAAEMKTSFGENGSYRLVSNDDIKHPDERSDKDTVNLLFPKVDYINFTKIAREYPSFHEVAIQSNEEFVTSVNALDSRTQFPIFIKRKNGSLSIITQDILTTQIQEGDALVYLGKGGAK